MRVKLLKGLIDRELSKGGEGDRVIFDTAVPGFGLRIRDGRGTFVYQYKLRGRSQRVVIDAVTAISLDEAREKALDLRREFQAGNNPAEMRRADRARLLTVAELLKAYLEDLQNSVERNVMRGNKPPAKRSTLAEFERLAAKAINPTLGRIEVEALDVARVDRWRNKFSESPTTANRALTLAKAAHRFGQQQGLVAPGLNPFAAVSRYPEKPRQERLTVGELARVGAALRESAADGTISPSVVLAVRLMLFCGLRVSEVLTDPSKARRSELDGLRWSDCDLDAGVLHLRDAKAGDRDVLISRPAVEALRAARPEGVSPDFPVCPGARPDSPLVGVDEQLRRVFDRAGVPWKGGVHCLRRTFSSVGLDKGYGKDFLRPLLGHGRGDVTDRYMIASPDALRAAVEAIGVEIAGALDGTLAPVLDFAKHRAGA
jgi:integrase